MICVEVLVMTGRDGFWYSKRMVPVSRSSDRVKLAFGLTVEISGISGGQVCVGDGIRYLLAKQIFALHQPLPRRLWNVCVTDPPICVLHAMLSCFRRVNNSTTA